MFPQRLWLGLVAVSALIGCVQSSSFSLPPSEGADLWILIFIPKDGSGSKAVVAIQELDGSSNLSEAVSFSHEDYDFYAALYGCSTSVLGLETGVQDVESTSQIQPIPPPAFRIYKSEIRDRQQGEWKEKPIDEALIELSEIRVRGRPVTCGLEFTHRELENTEQILKRPMAVALDSNRILYGIEGGPFEIAEGLNTVSVEISATTPALAGAMVGEQLWLIGSGGRVARGTVGPGFTVTSDVLERGAQRAASLIGYSEAGGERLLAISDFPALEVWDGQAWDAKRVFGKTTGILAADLLVDSTRTYFGAFTFQRSVSVYKESGELSIVQIPLTPNCDDDDDDDNDCDGVVALALDASGEGVLVVTNQRQLYRVRNGLLEDSDLKLSQPITSLARWKNGLVAGDALGGISIINPDGSRCEVTNVQSVVSEIVLLESSFVAISKDQRIDPVQSTTVASNVRAVIARSLRCEAPL